jgi:hypothetical protein
MRAIRESVIEKMLREGVEALDGKAWKFTTTEAGVADRIVALPYLPVWFVELKRPKKQLAALQEKHKRWLLARGHRHAMLDTTQAVAHWLAERHQEIANRKRLYE